MAIVSGPKETDLAKPSFQRHHCFLVLTPGAVYVRPLKPPAREQNMAEHGKSTHAIKKPLTHMSEGTTGCDSAKLSQTLSASHWVMVMPAFLCKLVHAYQ